MNFLTKNIRIISIAVFVVVVIVVLITLQGGRKTERSFFAFDTLVEFTLSGRNSEKAADEIEQTLYDMEKSYSKYLSDSVISKFNSLPQDQTVTISDEMADLIRRCCEISQTSDGAFDITTSKLSYLWQVKTATAPPSHNDITVALENTGYNKIQLSGNTLSKTDADIDFGGVLKGAAADKVRSIAQKYGITSGIVNLGGNVCLIGLKDTKPWTVGIVNPFSPGEVYLTVEAENTNVITSGAYQRYFEYDNNIYHHIISPQTGYPAQTDIASVTVISPDGTLADALSTAIFVLGSEKGIALAEEYNVGALIIKKDGSVMATNKVEYTLQN